jgi:hypothetical protein
MSWSQTLQSTVCIRYGRRPKQNDFPKHKYDTTDAFKNGIQLVSVWICTRSSTQKQGLCSYAFEPYTERNYQPKLIQFGLDMDDCLSMKLLPKYRCIYIYACVLSYRQLSGNNEVQGHVGHSASKRMCRKKRVCLEQIFSQRCAGTEQKYIFPLEYYSNSTLVLSTPFI